VTRESALSGASPITAAKRDQSKCTAELRARALALVLTAIACGKWAATPEILDALADLGWAVVWDFETAA
jgi:hypothetical protein